jgi:hypothetical protein
MAFFRIFRFLENWTVARRFGSMGVQSLLTREMNSSSFNQEELNLKGITSYLGLPTTSKKIE